MNQINNGQAIEYPYKIMILGDEERSGKFELYHLLTMSNPNFDNLPPCNIHTHIVEVEEEDFALELWTPVCDEHSDKTRTIYYPGTDAFIIVFSASSEDSIQYTTQVLLPEVRYFIDHFAKYKDVPVILVATNVKKTPNNIINIAQENGVSKYVEVQFSQIHTIEVFTQAINAIQAFHSSSSVNSTDRVHYSDRERQFFRSSLTSEAPDGDFDQVDKTLEITTMPGTIYFYTLDGSEPTKSSKRYTNKISLHSSNENAIKMIAVERCKYASEVVIFNSPIESSPPQGYFDPISKSFHIIAKAGCNYYYSLDGSKPDKHSALYSEPEGVLFDDVPNTAFESHLNVPQLVRVVAIEKDKLKSKIKNFKPYDCE
ncbi:Ras-like protein Rho [Acrasis kona]|uniref:Ras-like protein Rho n=1 Tax=Acrasis kona TaxID=1008807 RepID=A0AAW2Z059_9EUKA